MAQKLSPKTVQRRLGRRTASWLRRNRGLVLVLAVIAGLTVGGLAVGRVLGPSGQEVLERGGQDQGVSREESDSDRQTLQNQADGGSGKDEDSGGETNQAAAQNKVIVHVDGAVSNPGVFELEGSSPRVRDAVDAAGGLRADADTSTINLAAVLSDGQKVHVPVTGETPAAQTVAADASSSSAGTSDGSSAEGRAGGTGSADQSGGLVNINTASVEELQSLSGVGQATAEAIVEDRKNNGPFKSPEDLMRVSGIGEKKFAKVKDHICV